MDTNEGGVDILYVEDDEVDIMATKKAFKKVNNLLTIEIASDGVNALDKLYGTNGEKKITPPKMILLDVNMPKMNGIEFLRILRSDVEFNSVAIYLLTVSYTSQEKLAIHDLKVSGCIVKPLEYSDALNIYWSLFSTNN